MPKKLTAGTILRHADGDVVLFVSSLDIVVLCDSHDPARSIEDVGVVIHDWLLEPSDIGILARKHWYLLLDGSP